MHFRSTNEQVTFLDTVRPAASKLRQLGSIKAVDSWGETLNQLVRIQRTQKH